MQLHGRREIVTNIKEITPNNVVDVLKKALAPHTENSNEIHYLYNYYRGIHPILNRIKEVRPEINNKIVENRAAEIVNFKTGYLMREPVQYISKDENPNSDKINRLNYFVFAEEKVSKDRELADDMHICGTSFRMILPDTPEDTDEAPFEINTLNPERTFVVYSNDSYKRPVLGVTYIKDDNGIEHYSCYTKDMYYEIVNYKVVLSQPHVLGDIPIIEYPLNLARMGAFECVIDLLEAIEKVDSNREDAIEEFVQCLLLLHNVSLEVDKVKALRDLGAIEYADRTETMKGEIKYLTSELNQTQTQTLVDYMYQTVLEICGMPSQGDGNSSDSSNNGAVIFKNGWYSAETMAINTEIMFKKSERRFLKLALNICRYLSDLDLKPSDVEIKFTRRNYENIQVKSQVLITMLSCDKIHPKLAFEYCGLFTDPDAAYKMSEQYIKEQEEKAKDEVLRTAAGNTEEDTGSPQQNGNSPSESGREQTSGSVNKEN